MPLIEDFMTINNLELFISGLWDWGILNGCFGGSRIRPTDIDGLVEKNGYFLLFETKRQGASIPMGQKIMFNNMIATQKFTVIVAWGETNTPTKLLMMTRHGEQEYNPATIESFRGIVTKWYDWAVTQK